MTEEQAIARYEALTKQLDADVDEIKHAVEMYGIDWLISHYHCAILNWSYCMDENEELKAKLKEYEQKADA